MGRRPEYHERVMDLRVGTTSAFALTRRLDTRKKPAKASTLTFLPRSASASRRRRADGIHQWNKTSPFRCGESGCHHGAQQLLSLQGQRQVNSASPSNGTKSGSPVRRHGKPAWTRDEAFSPCTAAGRTGGIGQTHFRVGHQLYT